MMDKGGRSTCVLGSARVWCRVSHMSHLMRGRGVSMDINLKLLGYSSVAHVSLALPNRGPSMVALHSGLASQQARLPAELVKSESLAISEHNLGTSSLAFVTKRALP